jgi:sensor histidine kinase YesM
MKRYLEIIAHFLFWLLTGYFFIKYSYIRPTIGVNFEILSTFLIAFTIYLNYFVLFPYIFKKNRRFLYILFSLLSVVLIACIEGMISSSIIYKTFSLPEPVMKDYIQSVYFFVGLRDFGFLLFFFILKFYLEAIKVNRLEREKFTIENTYLRSRIAPHFLYNVLNSIYADAILKDEKLPDYIFQLSKLLHYYVDESHRDLVPIEEEIQFYKRYIDLENKRYDHKIQVQMEAPELNSSHQIAPLLFEPIISNAFKYVLKDGTGEVFLRIFYPSKNVITFECVNNKWNDTTEHLDTTSKGLSNLQARLALLYPEKHTLHISESENQFHVSLTINL